MKEYKISIIIPVYNTEKYLKRTIESVLNQTIKDIEIILVDDKTPDNAGRICDEYAKANKNIRVIHKEKNEGLGMARNTGMNIANGEYIAFLDSDDTVDSKFYEKLYNSAQKYNSDIAMGQIKFLVGEKEVEKNNLDKEKYEGNEIINIILRRYFGNSKENITPSATRAIYKRMLLEKYKIKFCSEREFRSEDLIFQIDIIPKCKIISYDKSAIYFYNNENMSSLTRKYDETRFKRDKILAEEVDRKLKEINLYEKMKDGTTWIFIGNVRVCIKQEKNNNKETAIENIKNICNDKQVEKALKVNIERTVKQKIFDNLIKYKKYYLLYIIAKFV